MFSQLNRFTKIIFGSLFSKPEPTPAPRKNPGRIKTISKLQYEKIEALCAKMLESGDNLQSGKIQFINFEQVREFMGSRWKVVEPIVLSIADEVILKYVGPDDIYFRYNEDDYMIIFSNASPAEAQAKCTLIATEIRNLIFTNLHDHPGIDKLKTASFFKVFFRSDLKETRNVLDHMSADLSQAIKEESPPIDLKSLVPTVSIAVPSKGEGNNQQDAKKQQKEGAEEDVSNRDITFYSIQLSRHDREGKNYIIYNDEDDGLQNFASPIIRYLTFAETLNKKQKALYNNEKLGRVIKSLQESDKEVYCCPLDFNTLLSDTYGLTLSRSLSVLTTEQKKRLEIFVNNIPDGVPFQTLERVIAPLEINCRTMSTLLPFSQKSKISNLINCGFKGVGFLVSENDFGSINEFISEGNALISRCRVYGLKTSIIVVSQDAEFINAAVDLDCDYIGVSPKKMD